MCNVQESFNCKHWKSDDTVDGYCNLKQRSCHTYECRSENCNVVGDCDSCTGCILKSGRREW